MKKRNPDKDWKKCPRVYCAIAPEKKAILKAILKERKQTIAQFLHEWIDTNIDVHLQGDE